MQLFVHFIFIYMQFETKKDRVDVDTLRENVLNIVATSSAKITPVSSGKKII